MTIEELIKQDRSLYSNYNRLNEEIDNLERNYKQLREKIERKVSNDLRRYLNREVPKNQRKFSDWKVEYLRDLMFDRDVATKIFITHFDDKEIWRGFDGKLFLVGGELPQYAEKQLEVVKAFSTDYPLKVKIDVQEEEYNPGFP